MSRGHEKGKGIGVEERGIAQPIRHNFHTTRAGLSSKQNAFEATQHVYEEEKVELEVPCFWCHPLSHMSNVEEFERSLSEWLTHKNRVNRVGIEWFDTFCDREIQKELFAAKVEPLNFPFGNPQKYGTKYSPLSIPWVSRESLGMRETELTL